MARTKQARRQRRARSRSAAAVPGESARRADVVVVLAHGIGNQRIGSLLVNMAGPCVRVLAHLAHARGYRVEQTVEVLPHDGVVDADEGPKTTTVTLTRGAETRKIVFVEALWSRSFTRPSWWRCVVWALRSLPALVLLLAPDQRDAEELAIDDKAATRPRGLRAHVAEALSFGGIFDRFDFVALRFAARVLVGVLLLGVPLAAIAAQPWLAVPLLLFAAWYLSSPHNVIGHVVVAASDPEELARIRARIAACLEWARLHGEKVVVVGHSQGGYLAHDVLAREPARRPPVAALVGVGSGLKPIWLLRELNRPIVLAAAWTTLAATIVSEVLVWPVLAGLGQGIAAATRSLLETAGEAVLPLGAADRFTPIDPSELVDWHGTLDSVSALAEPSPPRIVAFLALLALLGLSRRLWKAAYPGRSGTGVTAVTARRWLELSSYHDPVGRLLFPKLPSPAHERAVTVGGHPIRDHVSYFSRGSIVPWRIGDMLMIGLGEPPSRPVHAAEAALNARAQRRRVVRFELLFAVVFLITLPLLLAGSSLIAAIWATGTTVLIAALILSTAFSWHESRANARTLDLVAKAVTGARPSVEISLPVPRSKRVLPVLILLVLTITSFAVMIQLIGYPVDDAQSPASFVNLTLLFFTYLVLVAAGYRPNLWVLLGLATLFALGHMTTVPPVPHPAAIPDWAALPGGGALLMIAIGTPLLLILLRRRRLAAVTVVQSGAQRARTRR